jgi:PilX N-terminal
METRKPIPERKSEKGAALAVSLFSLLLVTVLGMGLMSVGEISRSVSANDRENTEALYLAESGLAHARKLIFELNLSTYSSVLTAGDGAPNTGDELSTNLVSSPITAETAGGRLFGSGSYAVRVRDDDDEILIQNPNVDSNRQVIVRSTGIGRNGSTATVEAVLRVRTAPGIIVDGNLRISGNPVLRGLGGSVHAGGTMDLDGHPCADQYFSATGNIIDADNATTGAGCGSAGDARPAQPPVTVPTFDIRTQFRHRATYILGIDGKVYNSAGTMIDDATSDGNWETGGMKWDWDSGGKRWSLGGNTVLDGTYYSEGNMYLAGNPGSSLFPKNVSLMAEGYIEVAGNPTIRPHLENYSLMAGTDLKMSGNAGAGTPNYEGLNYAGHQVSLSGNIGINGQVVAKNLADTVSPGGTNPIPLQSGYMVLSGNPTITYSGTLLGEVKVVSSWREVRF